MKENLFLEWKVINRQVRTMKLRCFINLNVTNKTLVDYHGLWSQVYTCNCAATTLLSFFFFNSSILLKRLVQRINYL